MAKKLAMLIIAIALIAVGAFVGKQFGGDKIETMRGVGYRIPQ